MGGKRVLYAAVAFWEKSGAKIVADYLVNQDPTYRAIVLSTIDRLKSSEDDKISVDQGKCIVHVLIGELHYACLTCRGNCPSETSQQESRSQIFLERLRSVYRELPILADLPRDLASLSGIDLCEPLKQIVDEYNREDVENSRSDRELAEVRRTLMDGVQKLIDQGQRLEDFVRRTQGLRIMSQREYEALSTTSQKKTNVARRSAVVVVILSATLFIFLLYIDIL